MSRAPRIAFIVEGKTDYYVLTSLVSMWLKGHYIPTQIQPESSNFGTGEGWGGVFKWCRQVRENTKNKFLSDPLFTQFDLVLIHIDGDVSFSHYSDIGIDTPPNSDIPCYKKGDSASTIILKLEKVLANWCGITDFPIKVITVIPVMATEAWLFSGLVPNDNRIIQKTIEQEFYPDDLFVTQPKGLRLVRKNGDRNKKETKRYREAMPTFCNSWSNVTSVCHGAKLFDQKFHQSLQMI